MVYIEPDVIWMVVVGFIVAFVLAIGIGANDVANTFGTSVGAKVLTLRQACVIASIVETLGAVLLGAKVTETIRKGIIDIEPYENNTELLMVGNVAALTGSCAWLIIATAFKMPVSGTHSIVGATVGFALVANGASGVNWKQLGFIVLSWFISPLLAGGVAVGLFMLCKFCILTKADPLEPGLRFLPIFYACTIVVNLFSIFYEGPETLGFDRIPLWGTFILSFGTGILTGILVRFFLIPWQRKRIKANVKRRKELEAIQAMERQKLGPEQVEMNDVPVKSEHHSTSEQPKRLEAIAEEDRRSVERNPVFHRVNFADPRDGGARSDEVVKPASNGGALVGNDNEVFKIPLDAIEVPTDTMSEGDASDSAMARSRSKSLIHHSQSSPSDSLENYKPNRVRSKSESTSDHLKKSQASQRTRTRTYSGSIDDLHDRRFVPVPQSMLLNIQKGTAQVEEAKLEKQGLAGDEIAQKTREAIEDRPEQHQLFSYLQILTAVFGGFAHGGNDVSNAIGPLVGIWITATTGSATAKVPAPMWILLYGGAGISVGLWIWGRRVIKTMGEDLAKITPSTGFCIELGSATTVLVASNFGLPISTTHCKVGAVVFVGWARARKNVDWRLFSTIFMAWILTLPVAGGISALVMLGLMQLI